MHLVQAFVQFFGGGGSVEHGRRSLIQRNKFHDLYTFNPGEALCPQGCLMSMVAGNGAGMYCDAFTTGTVWRQNLVFHCGGTGSYTTH